MEPVFGTARPKDSVAGGVGAAVTKGDLLFRRHLVVYGIVDVCDGYLAAVCLVQYSDLFLGDMSSVHADLYAVVGVRRTTA